MLIQKTFHVKKSVDETKAWLSDLRAYRRWLDGVRRAAFVADGVGEFEFEVGGGFLAGADIGLIAGEEPDQILFHSLKGNIELAGMAEFYEVKPELTEVSLTIDYSIRAPFYRLLDAMTNSIDRFINNQLRRLERHLNGLGVRSAAPLAPVFIARSHGPTLG